MTGYSFSTPVRTGSRWVRPVVTEAVTSAKANGPEDQAQGEDAIRWDAIDWRACEDQVRRLRQRIFKAAREQDWPKVRNLQKMMLRRSGAVPPCEAVTVSDPGSTSTTRASPPFCSLNQLIIFP